QEHHRHHQRDRDHRQEQDQRRPPVKPAREEPLQPAEIHAPSPARLPLAPARAPVQPSAMSDAAKVRVVLAPNPSAMTGPGTNSFLTAEGEVAMIDRGTNLPAQIDAILELAEGWISHVLVPHAHLYHRDGVARFSQATRAPVYAFGAPDSGSSPT